MDTKKKKTLHPSVLKQRYNSAITTMIFISVLTILNLVLLLFNDSDTYFLFSAIIPYYIASFAKLMCGLYPPEFYVGLGIEEFLSPAVFYAALAVSIVLAAVYLILGILARKQKGKFLIAGLVLFAIDTVTFFLLYDFSSSLIIFVVFHALAIVELAFGISAYKKLQSMPEGETASESLENELTDAPVPPEEESTPLRAADMTVKYKTLLEYNNDGYHILYRRVKRTNELVINGRVYAEYTALAELPHYLYARIDGHLIAAGLTIRSMSFIEIDGEVKANMLRLI